MSYKRKRNQRWTAVFASAIGLILVFTFVLSLLNINPGNDTGEPDDASFPTLIPSLSPTDEVVPTPEPDPQLAGGRPYIHSSGYFQTFRPLGGDWQVSEDPPGSEADLVRVVIQSGPRLALFHNFLVPGIEYETAESLSENYLTQSYYDNAWAEYDSWSETARDIIDGNVVIDFALVVNGNDYQSRSIHEMRNGWLYVTRIVVPANNPVLLERLVEWVSAEFQPFERMQELPLSWPTHIDQSQGYLLKYSPDWELVAGRAGSPVTLDTRQGLTEGTLRVWAEPGLSFESVQDARDWLTDTEPTAELQNDTSYERDGVTVFELLYSYRDTAGDAHTGLAVLQQNASETVFVANLQLDPPDLDLLDDGALDTFALEARQIVTDGFMVLP